MGHMSDMLCQVLLFKVKSGATAADWQAMRYRVIQQFFMRDITKLLLIMSFEINILFQLILGSTKYLPPV